MSDTPSTKLDPMRIVVTGSAGALGRPLVEALQADGHLVRGYDKEPAGEETIVGDLTNYNLVFQVCQGADAICHCGAIPGYNDDDISMFGNNIRGTFNVFLAAIRGQVKKVVLASSLAILLDKGLNDPPPPEYLPMDERHPPRCQDIYGSTKLFGEELGRIYAIQHGMSVICLRPHQIVQGELSDFGEPLGEGRVAVWDVIEAFKLALATDRKYGVYNITGKDWSHITAAKAQAELGYTPRW